MIYRGFEITVTSPGVHTITYDDAIICYVDSDERAMFFIDVILRARRIMGEI